MTNPTPDDGDPPDDQSPDQGLAIVTANTAVIPNDDAVRRILDAVSDIQREDQALYFNMRQRFIVVTEDKLRLYLNEYLDRMQQSTEWLTPFGLVVTIIITLVTATFQNIFLPAATWEAIFWLSLVVSSIWLIRILLKRPKSMTLDQVVEKFMEASNQSTGRH